MKTAILLLSLVCLFGPPDQEGRLIQRGQLKLPVPDNANPIPSTIQYVEKGDKPYLYTVNSIENEILSYDLSSYQVEPVSLTPKPDFRIAGFGVSGQDVFIYQYRPAKVHRYHDGKRTASFNIVSDKIQDGRRVPYPFVTTFSSIKEYKNKVILSGRTVGETMQDNQNPEWAICILNPETGSVEYGIDYPEIYQKYYWGGGLAYWIPYFDIGKETLVVSFSASEDLTAMNLSSKKIKTVSAPSRYVKKIKPYGLIKAGSAPNDKLLKWYRENPSYEGILYDRWNQLYYRFVYHPEKENTKRIKTLTHKPVSVIILDTELKVCGETMLPEDIYFFPDCSIVSPDGLYIRVMTQSEDEMLFYRYVYVDE